MSGPLSGVRAVELGGVGPGPFAAMVLADMGAEVVRIDRPGAAPLFEGLNPAQDVLLRGRWCTAVDLKTDKGRALVARMVDDADVFIDPFRPGAAERLGLGPEELCARNPGLIYARVTGWGQQGPLAERAGHDINYLALTGPLAAMGRRTSPPAPPLNLVGDYGGGGMLAALGIVAALFERGLSGLGQVVDAAMVDGIAQQFASIMGFRAMGIWEDRREANFLDGGAPFYDCYETADGRFVSVGAIEPPFYAQLLALVGFDPDEWPQYDRTRWPELRRRLTAAFESRPRDEWARLVEELDACVTPVLTPVEAARHPHNAERQLYVELDGVPQPAPAPRFSRTPSAARSRASVAEPEFVRAAAATNGQRSTRTPPVPVSSATGSQGH